MFILNTLARDFVSGVAVVCAVCLANKIMKSVEAALDKRN